MNGSNNSESVEDRLDKIEGYLGTIAKLVSNNQESEKKPKGFFDLSEPFLKFITTILAAIAGISGLIYAFGFLVINIYLGSFGSREYSLSSMTYLSAGLLFLLFHLIVFIMFSAGNVIYSAKEKDRERKSGYYELLRSISITILSLLFIGPIFIIAITLVMPNTSLWELVSASPLYFLALVIFGSMFGSMFGLVLVDGPTHSTTEKVSAGLRIYLVIFLSATVLSLTLLTLSSWATKIYPLISPEYGGGFPAEVYITTKEEYANHFSELGMDINNNVIGPIRLQYDTDTVLLILQDDGSLLKVDKSLVSNILFLKLDNPNYSITPGIVTTRPITTSTPTSLVTPTDTAKSSTNVPTPTFEATDTSTN